MNGILATKGLNEKFKIKIIHGAAIDLYDFKRVPGLATREDKETKIKLMIEAALFRQLLLQRHAKAKHTNE